MGKTKSDSVETVRRCGNTETVSRNCFKPHKLNKLFKAAEEEDDVQMNVYDVGTLFACISEQKNLVISQRVAAASMLWPCKLKRYKDVIFYFTKSNMGS